MVVLDSNLSFENHISHVTKTAFFHLRNSAKLRNILTVSDAEKLVHAFMTSRLDYCNALLDGCPASSINKLQIVQHAVARVLTRSRKYDHINPILRFLHCLTIKFPISYKILLLTYKALNDLAPAYLTNLLSRYNPTRSLRSQNSGLLVVPTIAKSTKGGWAFSYLAPKLWNSLPDNVRGSVTLFSALEGLLLSNSLCLLLSNNLKCSKLVAPLVMQKYIFIFWSLSGKPACINLNKTI